mgnify:CR=1 FL=1
MLKNILESKKGLSPVIATVILVAVTIVVVISVAYWMGSLSGAYTRFESVEIQTAYSTKVSAFSAGPFAGSQGWIVTFGLKNTGSADATVDGLFLNGKPLDSFASVAVYYNGVYYQVQAMNATIISGAAANLDVYIVEGLDNGITFVSGLRLDAKFHTAAGKEYPKLVQLV